MKNRPEDQQQREQKRAVTLKDVATHCGLSVSTVCMALKNPARFSSETSDKVLASAHVLGYDATANQGARRLVMRRFGKQVMNHLLAVLLPEQFYRAAYYAEFYQGLVDVATAEGFGLLMVDVPEQGLPALPPSIRRGDVDGCVIMLGAQAPQVLQQLRAQLPAEQVPVISGMTALQHCSAVITDAVSGAAAEVAHLLQLGHRHFLHLCRPGHEPFGFHQDQLLDGYRYACRQFGLDPESQLHAVEIDPMLWKIGFVAGEITKLWVLDRLKWPHQHPCIQTLTRHPEITAVLAPNDPTAIVLHHLLSLAGLRVPTDISLVGFDDTDPLLDEAGENSLTTVRLPLRELGRQAASLLLRRITGQVKGDTQLVLPGELVLRRTTAPPPGRSAREL